MRRHCVPVRGNHDLLTPDTHTQSGVKSRPVTRSGSGPTEPETGPQSRQSASLTRRLRFEDETEVEAEYRYLERQQQRQRRWIGQGAPEVLVSKPILILDTGSGAEAGPRDGTMSETGRTKAKMRKATGTTPVTGKKVEQQDFPEKVQGLDRDLRVRLALSDQRHSRLSMWTEAIRETYIGAVAPSDEELPINPYAPERWTDPKPMKVQGAGRTKEDPNKQELKGTCRNLLTESDTRLRTQTDPQGQGTLRQPIGAELQGDADCPERLSRDASSRRSLRHFFSTVTLSRTRAGSLDRLTSQLRASAPDLLPARSGSGKFPGRRRTSSPPRPFTTGAPFPQLRKSLSIQNFSSQQKKEDKVVI